MSSPNDPSPPNQGFPEAQIRRRKFQAVWFIPIIVGLIVGYLAIRSYISHGPTIVITFPTASGLSVGQTSLRYKFVALGTVESIDLNEDKSVDVHVRMGANTKNLLSDHARFWIEKPHFATTDIANIVSGTYIALDPGPDGGEYQTKFTGLENPPDLPVDDAGTTFSLKADRLGSIAATSPVYYRDINVGEVLGTNIGDGVGPITVKILVRSPFDKFVKPTSHFWNASGFSVKFGAEGLHAEVESLQSVLGGSIAFSTPPSAITNAQADQGHSFKLYPTQKQAEEATTSVSIPCVTYLEGAIKDLAPGSPVQIFGIQVGKVTGVKLSFDQPDNQPKVRVNFDFDPDLAFGPDAPHQNDATQIMQKLLQSGMRAAMKSTDLIVGQEIVSLEFVPEKDVAAITREADAIVIPAQSGSADLTGALSEVAAKLNQIPFEQIGDHLNHLLASADETIGSPDMRQAVHSLAVTLANAQDLSAKANTNLTPALQRLPDISSQLQSAVAHTNAFMTSLNAGYGQNSDFQRNASHVLDEVNDAARSIRLLADFLERHPEALLEGKSPEKGKP